MRICVCVCSYWDAVMSWTCVPVCKWKRCSSWKLWAQTQFAQFNWAQLALRNRRTSLASAESVRKYREMYDTSTIIKFEACFLGVMDRWRP